MSKLNEIMRTSCYLMDSKLSKFMLFNALFFLDNIHTSVINDSYSFTEFVVREVDAATGVATRVALAGRKGDTFLFEMSVAHLMDQLKATCCAIPPAPLSAAAAPAPPPPSISNISSDLLIHPFSSSSSSFPSSTFTCLPDNNSVAVVVLGVCLAVALLGNVVWAVKYYMPQKCLSIRQHFGKTAATPTSSPPPPPPPPTCKTGPSSTSSYQTAADTLPTQYHSAISYSSTFRTAAAMSSTFRSDATTTASSMDDDDNDDLARRLAALKR
jgi:hypothetical protein